MIDVARRFDNIFDILKKKIIGLINKGKILSRYNIRSAGSKTWDYAKIYGRTLISGKLGSQYEVQSEAYLAHQRGS